VVSLPAIDAIPEPTPPQRRGLRLILDVIVAPKQAFASIAATREWLPAFFIVSVLGFAGSLMLGPALQHVIAAEVAADPSAAHAGPADVARLAGYEVAGQVVWQIIGSLMLWLWTAVILTAVSGAGPSSFRVYFSLAANTAIPASIGFFVLAMVISLHDPSGYANFSALNRALPDNLAFFAPGESERGVSFLASFDLFGLWSSLLLAFGLRAIGKVDLFWALVTAFSLWLAYAVVQTIPGL